MRPRGGGVARHLGLGKRRTYPRPGERQGSASSVEQSTTVRSASEASSIYERQPTPLNLIDKPPVLFTPSPTPTPSPGERALSRSHSRSHSLSSTASTLRHRSPAGLSNASTPVPGRRATPLLDSLLRASSRTPLTSMQLPDLPGGTPSVTSPMSSAKSRSRSRITRTASASYTLPSPLLSTINKQGTAQISPSPFKRPLAQNRRKQRGRGRKQGVEREIARLQRSTELLVSRRPFARLVRELGEKCGEEQGHRWQAGALLALQEASESYLVTYLEDLNTCAHHANRVTINTKDVELLRKLRRDR